jgi:hypothetical protein
VITKCKKNFEHKKFFPQDGALRQLKYVEENAIINACI